MTSDELHEGTRRAAERLARAAMPPHDKETHAMTEHELTRAIGRAFTDILDAVMSYAAQQVALAVTPRPPTGEPDECCASAATRVRELTQLATEILGHFNSDGILAGSLTAKVPRPVIARWRATLASQPAEPATRP